MKLKITQLEIDADAETLGRALPILARLAQGSTIELPPADDPPAASPAPQPAEPDCCREPSPPKPRRQYKRKPKDDPPPDRSASPRATKRTAESSGPLRVNTGRSKERETLDALRQHGPCGASRLAAIVGGGVSSAAMYQRLLGLMGKGLVRKGDQPGTFEVIDE